MILSRKHYAWFALGFIGFVVYASLVPLRFTPLPLDRGFEKFLEMMQAPISFQSKSDWLSNILLFIPLGFVAMGMLQVDRPSRWWAVPLVLVFCTFLSAAIEFTQVWFPPRHTSPNDVIAESLGGFLGVIAWAAMGQNLTEAMREFWSVHSKDNWAIKLLPAYLLLLVILYGVPFNITISPGELMQKYRDGRIRVIPFDYRPTDQPKEIIEKIGFTIAYFIPAGVLLAAIRRPDGSQRFPLGVVLLFGLGLTASIELMQIFIQSRFADSTDILTGTLGVYLGWCLLKLAQYENSRRTLTIRFTCLVIWSLVLVAIHWFPYQFSTESDYLTQRWDQFNWMPFLEYQSGNYLSSFNNILEKTLLFVPFGMLLERALPALLLGLVFSIMIEAGQFFIPARSPGITDPIIETVGSVIGAIGATRLQRFTRRETP
jgi:glycopeptide antibiotics resistance protein